MNDMSSTPATGAPVLVATGLGRRFHEGPLDVQVLTNVDLTVHAGETLAIVGASGSGKSTLLHLLGGLDAPTTGRVMLQGQDVHALSPAAQGLFRNEHLGFVYQFHHLLPEFSALDNVAMPLLIRRVKTAEAHTQAHAMLESVGLGPRAQHRPGELSGGERQRVAIARAFMADAPILILDEATSSLDVETEKEVAEATEALMKGRTTIVIAHRLSTVRSADRILVFQDGRVVEEGRHADLVARGGAYARLSALAGA